MFEEAEKIALLDPTATVQTWIAVHVKCGGTLSIVDDDWACEKCGVRFHDDHCADVLAERKDAIARHAASVTHQVDAAMTEKILAEERAEIHAELVAKRKSRARERSAAARAK